MLLLYWLMAWRIDKSDLVGRVGQYHTIRKYLTRK